MKSNEKAKEIAIELLEELEDILNQHKITIPDDWRCNEDNEARLYGEQYWNCEDDLRESLKNKDLTAEECWEIIYENIIPDMNKLKNEFIEQAKKLLEKRKK